jgi:6-phosphogluconate dehydrogenase
MQLGMIGLGRMGANLVRRLTRDGHECVVYDQNLDAVQLLSGEGAVGAATLEQFVAKLDQPRAVWVMVPAAITGLVVDELAALLEPDDVIIDGGNSYYRDDIDRANTLGAKEIHYVDVGTSGGIFGLERGFCLMIGGEPEPVRRLDPIFASIAPGLQAAPRTPSRAGEPSTAERGYLHCGPSGAGHFVKMIHNGIEYGLMALTSCTGRTPAANSGPATPRPHRFEIASTTTTGSTWPRSRRSGAAARSSPPGCST